MSTRRLTAAAALLLLALSGCGGGGRPEGRQATSAGSSADLSNAPVDKLRSAMPEKDDFPAGWTVTAQPNPPALLPGLDATSTQISSVSPAPCLDFIAGFVSAPGSSVPGEFVASVVAQIPAPKAGTVTVLAVRKARNWQSPAKVRETLRDCANAQAHISFGGQAAVATFDSSPIDASAVNAEAAGRATLVRAGNESASFELLSAQIRGVLVTAIAQTGAEADNDQRALLLQLVAQTAGKLGAL